MGGFGPAAFPSDMRLLSTSIDLPFSPSSVLPATATSPVDPITSTVLAGAGSKGEPRNDLFPLSPM